MGQACLFLPPTSQGWDVHATTRPQRGVVPSDLSPGPLAVAGNCATTPSAFASTDASSHCPHQLKSTLPARPRLWVTSSLAAAWALPG